MLLEKTREFVRFDRKDMFFPSGCFKARKTFINQYGYEIKPGDVIGAIREDGLWRIKLFNVKYDAQQFSWFYHYGMWADRILAGEQGPICLLPERLYNWTPAKDVVFVSRVSRSKRWKATVRVRNKKVVLGRDYPDRQAAAAACDAAVHDGWNPELCVDAAEWEMLYGI